MVIEDMVIEDMVIEDMVIEDIVVRGLCLIHKLSMLDPQAPNLLCNKLLISYVVLIQ